MSTNYYIHCTKCGVSCHCEYNRQEKELIEAVKEAFYPYIMRNTGWDISTIEYGSLSLRDLGRFLAEHYECQSFVVRCEYHYSNPAKYPDVPVTPWEPSIFTQGAYI